MNKADEKRLRADPRFQRIVAAYDAREKRLAEAEAIKAEALAAYAVAAPECPVLHCRPDIDAGLPYLLNALRPKGDTVRLAGGLLGRQTSEAEIESVTENRIRLVGWPEEFTRTGYRRGGLGAPWHILAEDVERVTSGELKGWRQKPWGP